MMWGDCQLELMSFKLSKMAYDVAMDIVDNANGDCSLTFIFRDDLYSQVDADRFSKSYISLAKAFASEPNTKLGIAKVYDEVEIKEVWGFGKGKILFLYVNLLLEDTGIATQLTQSCP